MPRTRANALRAVMFTDVVGSTELARELGDERWARLLAAQRKIVRQQVRAGGGREVDTAGDGFFAVFEGPADAVRSAFAAAREVQDLGLDIRAGVHFGEIDTTAKEAHGIVVHTGARVMGQAGAAEVVVTQTVKDLVAGSTFELHERGTVELKGVPGTWNLFDVAKVDDEIRAEPIENATVASERRERASARPPKRTRPRWLIAAAVASVLVVAGAAFLGLRSTPTFVPAAGTVARIDGNRFDRPIEVGSNPIALTEGLGRIWALDRGSQLYWVDENDNSTGARGTDGVPTGAAVGDDALWITTGYGSAAGPDTTVGRFDPTSGQLNPAFHVPIDSRAIAFGDGAVWVADVNTGDVTRYDPVTRTSRPIRLPGSRIAPRPDSIAFGTLGGDAVWVGDDLSTNVYRISTSGSNQVRTFTVGAPPSAIATGSDAVWVASAQANAVYSLDPSTGSLRSSIDVGTQGCSAPTSIAVNTQGVWVACADSERVVRIDPAQNAVDESWAVGGTVSALTSAADGSVWVAVQPS